MTETNGTSRPAEGTCPACGGPRTRTESRGRELLAMTVIVGIAAIVALAAILGTAFAPIPEDWRAVAFGVLGAIVVLATSGLLRRLPRYAARCLKCST